MVRQHRVFAPIVRDVVVVVVVLIHVLIGNTIGVGVREVV